MLGPVVASSYSDIKSSFRHPHAMKPASPANHRNDHQDSKDQRDASRPPVPSRPLRPLSPSEKNNPPPAGFIPPHGGYQALLAYQKALVVFDATLYFCNRFIDKRSRTHDQMVQAACSGVRNAISSSKAASASA
jgi:hypothetical protein